MAENPNRRTDTTGSRRGKRGNPLLSLPTQSLSDLAFYQDVPYFKDGATFELPAFHSAHPRHPDYKVVHMEPFATDDNVVLVRITFRKLPGLTLTTVNAADQEALGGRTETAITTVAADAPEPTGGFGVLQAVKQQVDGATARVITKTAETPYPVLTGDTTDPDTGIVVHQSKTIVAAGTTGGIIGGWYTDIQPLDKYRSIQIAQKVDLVSLPSPKTWKHTIQKAFPAQLVDQYFIAYISSDGTSVAERIPFWYETIAPFTASCEATTVRSYLSSEPDGTEAETPFNAQSHRVFAQFYDADSDANSGGTIPETLHGELSERWGAFQVGVGWLGVSGVRPGPLAGSVCFVSPFAQGNIPATNPSSLVVGSTFIHKVNAEKWRFGLWVKEVTTAKIPNYNA